jgi:hypothetical protein
MRSVKIGFYGTLKWRKMDNQFLETILRIYQAFSVIFFALRKAVDESPIRQRRVF